MEYKASSPNLTLGGFSPSKKQKAHSVIFALTEADQTKIRDHESYVLAFHPIPDLSLLSHHANVTNHLKLSTS